jgi:hypothetical protein
VIVGDDDALTQRVRDQLTAWGLTAAPEGAQALAIAERLGAEGLRPAAAAMLHGQLRAVLADLRKLAPPAESNDDIDELAAQRAARRKAAGLA